MIGVLGRLKFISKGEEHQVYGKLILYILVTYDIKNSEAYKMFIALSTGLIPPKKERGKGAQGSKETVIPKKATFYPKKKIPKKKLSSGDESDNEPANRPTGRRKPREINTHKAIKASKRESRFKHQSGGSSKGDGITQKVSTDYDEEDDESIDIEKTDDERTESDNDDHEITDAVKTDADTLVEENDEKEHEKNAKKFLNNSPNVSLIGTIQENAKVEINYLLDIQIQQEVPTIQQEPFHEIKVFDIPDPTQIPPSTPPTTSLPAKKAPAILESIKSQVPSAVNKYLGSSLEDTLQKKDVSEIIKVKQEHVANEKMPKHSTTQFDQDVDDEYVQKEILFKIMMASKSYEKHPAHKAPYDALIQSLLVDKNDMDRLAVDPLSQKKRRHEDKDQDPPAGSDQGKKKRRTIKDAKPSMKSSKFKESAKVPMDVEEPNLHNVANDADEPQVDAIPKIPKQDWFKKPPRLETPDLD
ncbi:hypothetical protein Tco_1219473 [Tanacetum coccineum]